MAEPTDIVGVVESISPVQTPLTASSDAEAKLQMSDVRFTNGEQAYLNLDLDDPSMAHRRTVLATQMKHQRPVFVKVSPRRIVEDVQIPVVGRVLDLTSTRHGLEVRLDHSAALRVLPRSTGTPALVQLLSRSLREGTLLVILDDDVCDDILDVRVSPPEFEPMFPALSIRHATSAGQILKRLSIVDEATAQQMFEAVAATTCGVRNPAPGCVPFLYVCDGCYARAHEMCRLMACRGVISAKLWVFGDLRPETANHPRCQARWSVHVAAVVRLGNERELLVIDPALFSRAVPRATWEGALNDPSAVSVLTDARVFLRAELGGDRDENPPVAGITETEMYLAEFRMRLQAMDPPPPFRHCESRLREVSTIAG